MNECHITLRDHQLIAARAGARTHICMPANRSPGQKMSFIGGVARTTGSPALRRPTIWRDLKQGDRLWIREEIALCINTKNPLRTITRFKADVPGGRIAIPTIDGFGKGKWLQRTREAHKMMREESRYTLDVTSIRLFAAQEIEWDEIQAEGTAVYKTENKGEWWQRNYGLTLPWGENQEIVGISFAFVAASIDGVAAEPHEKAPNPVLREMFGARE